MTAIQEEKEKMKLEKKIEKQIRAYRREYAEACRMEDEGSRILAAAKLDGYRRGLTEVLNKDLVERILAISLNEPEPPTYNEFPNPEIVPVGDKEIMSNRAWTYDRVRRVCINEGFYTRGCVDDYQSILEFANNNLPTLANVYTVAKDILDHSDIGVWDVTDIMQILENEAIVTTFQVTEREDV